MKKMKINIVGLLTLLVLLVAATNPICMETSRNEGGEILWIYDSDLFIKHVYSADLNGDDVEDLISAEYDSDGYDDISKVYGINGVNGSTLWTYSLDDGARSMTIGDINNDGVMDAVIGASKGSSTPDGKVHAVDGTDGSQIWVFTPGSNGDTNGDVAIGDFNGDVYPDVAVACWDDFVYAINGEDGSELWNYEIDSIFVNAVSTDDVDGDGIDDVSYAHEYLAGWDNEIGVLNGSTGEVFWNRTITEAGIDTILCDIDDDGEVESIYGVVKDNDDVEIQVRSGINGSMEWSSVIGTGLTGTNPGIFLFVYDIDQNNDLDLIVGNEFVDYHIRAYDGDSSTLMWLSEELNGYARHMSFSDVNGNGDVNVIAATYDRVQVLNATDGTKNWYLSVAGTIRGTAVGDFDDDGIDDVACSGGAEFSGDDPGKSVWAIKTSSASPILWEFDVEEYGSAVAMGEFTGDSILDVIGVTSNDKAWAIDGPTGDELWNWTGTNNLYTVCTGDFDGDGIDDAAVAGADDRVTALNGSNGNILWEFTSTTDQLYRKCLKSSDLTNDEKIDVIAGCDDSYVYAINGENGSIIWSVDLDGSVRDINLYEINEDGVVDVLAAASNEIAFIDGSDGSKLWSYTSGVSSAKHAVALDVNDDGVEDVAWGSYTKVVLVDGASESELWSVSSSVNSDYCLSFGDMNDDTIPDVVFGGGSTGQDIIALHGMNGSVIWEYPTGGDINCVLTSNVDDDDSLEVVAGSDDQYLYILDPNGTHLWSHPTADDVMHIAIGDITGDSNVDFAAITFGFDGVVYAFQSLASYQSLMADFSIYPLNPTVNDNIQFNDTSISNEGVITSWFWDFDDGNTSDIQHPMHNYSSPGYYTVCLTVTNEYDENDSICKNIHVYGVGEGIIDANQSLFDRGFRVMPGWDGAQEFKPTYNILSRVDLYMTTWGDPWGPIVFQICEDTANGNVEYSDTISKDDCPDFPSFGWVTVDISGIPLTPGERYVIVLKDGDDGDTHNNLMWGWCDSYGGLGPYPDGEFLFRKLGYPTWFPIHDWDFTFRTYGYN